MNLFHRVAGTGDPLVLLHGLFGSSDNLGSVAKTLSQTFEVHSLDLRNHGRSPHSDQMDYPSMARDVAEYIQQRGLSKVSVLGHSMGGKAAMELALAYPETVDKLVVVDIAPVAYDDKHGMIFKGIRSLEVNRLSSRREAEEILGQYIAEQDILSFILKNLVKQPNGGFAWRMNTEVLYDRYSEIRAGLEGKRQFGGPVLFLGGGRSDYILPEHGPMIRDLFPSAQYKSIDNAGHWLHVEKASTFLRLTQRFLAQ